MGCGVRQADERASWWDDGTRHLPDQGADIDAEVASSPTSTEQPTRRSPDAAKRVYRSEVRREQALRTQTRVVEAAATLFAAQGYAKTSIRQVAEAAGVSVETIYAAGDKRALFLQAFELALRGDTEGTPLLELAPLAPAVAAVDLDQFLSAVVDFVVDANAPASRLWIAFVEGASGDPVLADAYAQQMTNMRRQGERVLEHAVERGLCPRPRNPTQAVDAIWAALHPSQYDLLVTQAGWSPTLYKAWLTSCVHHVLATL